MSEVLIHESIAKKLLLPGAKGIPFSYPGGVAQINELVHATLLAEAF